MKMLMPTVRFQMTNRPSAGHARFDHTISTAGCFLYEYIPPPEIQVTHVRPVHACLLCHSRRHQPRTRPRRACGSRNARAPANGRKRLVTTNTTPRANNFFFFFTIIF